MSIPWNGRSSAYFLLPSQTSVMLEKRWWCSVLVMVSLSSEEFLNMRIRISRLWRYECSEEITSKMDWWRRKKHHTEEKVSKGFVSFFSTCSFVSAQLPPKDLLYCTSGYCGHDWKSNSQYYTHICTSRVFRMSLRLFSSPPLKAFYWSSGLVGLVTKWL